MEVTGKDLSDPLTQQRLAIFKPLAEELLQRMYRGLGLDSQGRRPGEPR